jgi:two-component system, sensor histidine kinase YesM
MIANHYVAAPGNRKWTGLRGIMDKIPRAAGRVICYYPRVPRYRTVRGSIFLSVSLLLVSVLLAFSFVVYDYASTVARERFAETLTSLSKSVLANLDSQVGEMNRLSLTLVYSQVFQDLYMRHLALPRTPESVEQRISKLENTEALIEICDTILGPNQSAPQINVFDPRGEMIGAGYYSRLIERDAKRESWYPEVMRKSGERVLLPPQTDALLEDTSVIVKGKRYVSLLRSFQDSMRSTHGIIEVKQYCDSLFSELDSLGNSTVSIFVVDVDGRILYPYDGVRTDGKELLRLFRKDSARRIATGTLPGKPDSQVFASAASEDTLWTVIIGEPSAGLSTSIMQYTTRIAALTLAAILCSLVASYFIARRVTVPIKALHAEIDETELENLDEVVQGVRGQDPGEIDSLRIAFHNMRLKLNESVQEAVSLKAHEKEAQLAALQSQLNPHFLHNMLQTIAIMAEESDAGAIQDLIVNLAKVLRYVSSTEETTATLDMEAKYAESYLSAMRARFGDSLDFVIDIPAEMREIVVPRLVFQPFIENCFKYGTTNRPPWRIELHGRIADGSWEVEILDNGPGFSAETLKLAGEKIAKREREGRGLPSLSISGMGILNSYERFKLVFGDESVFEIGNRSEGGARISMGARIHG